MITGEPARATTRLSDAQFHLFDEQRELLFAVATTSSGGLAYLGIPTPNHPSYPAAHGCISSGAAATLIYLFPRDSQTLNALADKLPSHASGPEFTSQRTSE
jgi:hypothetical protein